MTLPRCCQVAVWSFLLSCSSTDILSLETTEMSSTNPLWIQQSKVWPSPTASGAWPLTIPVCWVAYPPDADGAAWTKDQVERTWEHQSDRHFTFWGPCSALSTSYPAIRIAVADTVAAPNVNPCCGTTGSTSSPSMTLNFTFQNWSPSCQTTREFCVRAIAAHEFGHALFAAHEHDRPDKPASCTQNTSMTADTMIGAWDANSIMNYCNPKWNNDGVLSPTDKVGLQQYYGTNGAKWLLHVGTNQGFFPTGSFLTLADVDGDTLDDLVAVYYSFGTGTNNVELHALSGASNFQSYNLHTGTNSSLPTPMDANTWSFSFMKYDSDKKEDLVAIKRPQGFNTEVHVLSASSNYSQFLLHTLTAMGSSYGPNWQAFIAPLAPLVGFQESPRDLVLVHRNYSVGFYQIWAYRGGSANYQTQLLGGVTTGVPSWMDCAWTWYVPLDAKASYVNNSPVRARLGCVERGPTASGYAEFWVPDPSAWNRFLYRIPLPAGQLPTNAFLAHTGMIGLLPYGDDTAETAALTYILGQAPTGANSTEIHKISVSSFQ